MSQVIPRTMARDDAQEAIKLIVQFFLVLSLGLAAVVPHSFQLVEAGCFVFTTALCFAVLSYTPWFGRVLLTYFLGVVATGIYVWIGYVNGAPRAASNQVLFVYIVSPLIWIVMSATLFQLMGTARVVQLLVKLTWIALVSVAAFFYLFLTFGKRAVQFLIADANVNVNGGYAAATILVYGSLIFLSGALFAEPSVIKNRYARSILPALLILCALTSGRSALILAIPAGLMTGVVLRSRLRVEGQQEKRSSVVLQTLGLLVIALAALVLMDVLLASVDLKLILKSFYSELMSGGGFERAEQSAALWEAFKNSWGLGVGHGVGIAYIRNFDYPWRYEVMPLATLMRVGILGSLAYLSTFIVYGQRLLTRLGARDLGPEDIYMAGGFAAVALAVATNPYIESFVFQWMYFLPVLSIGVYTAGRIEKKT